MSRDEQIDLRDLLSNAACEIDGDMANDKDEVYVASVALKLIAQGGDWIVISPSRI